MNDSRPAENEIIQLMLYREAFFPPGPSAKELYGPFVRKVESLDKRLADAESRIFDNFDDAIQTGQSLVGTNYLWKSTQNKPIKWMKIN